MWSRKVRVSSFPFLTWTWKYSCGNTVICWRHKFLLVRSLRNEIILRKFGLIKSETYTVFASWHNFCFSENRRDREKKFHYYVMSSNFLLLKISFSPEGSQRVLFCLHDPLLPVLLECVVPENIQTPSTEGIGNSWGVGGSQSPKNWSKCMKLDWNLQRGGRGGGLS